MKIQSNICYLFALTMLLGLLWACKEEKIVTPSTPTTPVTTKSSAKDITKFSFAALSPVVDATIDATAKTISATVPAATDITKLVPTITLSDKATVSPATGVAQDFSKEVSYTVTAEDASTAVWKVNVKKEAVVVVSTPDPKPEDNDSPDGMYYNLGVLDVTTGNKKWEERASNYRISEVSNGVVYAISLSGKNIEAYSAINGALKWKKQIVDVYGELSNPKIQSGVLVIAYNGDFADKIPAKVMGLDPLTGNVLWEYKQAQNKNGTSGGNFPLTASGGNVYVVQDRKTMAIEAKTGKLKWEIGGDYSIDEYNGFLLGRLNYDAGGGQGTSNAIYKFDKSTGSPSILVSGTDVNRTPYVVSSGILYFADYNSSTAKIYAIDANSRATKWAVAVPTNVTDWNNVPIAYNGLVYFSGSDKTIYAYDSQTGVKKWETNTGVSNRVLVAAKNLLYSTNIIVSAETGEIKWKNAQPSPFITTFKLVRDKKLYEAQKPVNDK